MRSIRNGVIALMPVTLCACGAFGRDNLIGPCPADFQTTINPVARTLRVGDSLRFVGRASTCGGATPLVATFRWSAADTTVIRVQTETGWVTALRVGSSLLTVRSVASGGAEGVAEATVTVER